MEIIVADGGSTDGTLATVPDLPRFKTVRSTRGRAPQMNAGAAVSTGKYFWFLHADTLPPTDWPVHLQNAARLGLPASFSLAFDGPDDSAALRFFARGSRLNHWSVRFGDQSLFLSRRQFARSGGFRTDHRLMEGHEMVRRLTRQNGGFHLLPAAVTTSARRYRRHGVVATQGIFTVIFFLYYAGVGQQQLERIYRRLFRFFDVAGRGDE